MSQEKEPQQEPTPLFSIDGAKAILHELIDQGVEWYLSRARTPEHSDEGYFMVRARNLMPDNGTLGELPPIRTQAVMPFRSRVVAQNFCVEKNTAQIKSGNVVLYYDMEPH